VKPHVDPDRSIGYSLKRLQQAVRTHMDAGLARHGLTAPRYAVLALLAAEPGMSNAELARRSFVTAPTMIRIMTSWRTKGSSRALVGARAHRRTRPDREGHGCLREAETVVEQIEQRFRQVAPVRSTPRWRVRDAADAFTAP
jgi:hypothetical protein